MLTVIITILLAIIVTVVLIVLSTKYNFKAHEITIITIGILIIGLSFAIAPIYGYEDPVLVKETKLVTLINDNELENDIYVTVSANNIYSYKYEVKKPYTNDKTSYEINIIRGDVIENESDKCTTPVLRQYERKAKTGLFSLCWEVKKEYEFYIPKGSIQRTDEVIN